MNLDELMRRDLRMHLEVGGVVVCDAEADGLSRTSVIGWATCSACLSSRPAAAVAAA